MSPSASLQIKGLATKYTTVKWPIAVSDNSSNFPWQLAGIFCVLQDILIERCFLFLYNQVNKEDGLLLVFLSELVSLPTFLCVIQ